MQFYILELQRKFEDVKELLNRKIGAFILVFLDVFKRSISKALLSRYFSLIACFLVAGLSIFIRSQRDIGHDSALFLDSARGMFESDALLTTYLSTIPHVLAKLLTINPIISLEICVNIMGVLSLYFSSKILKRSAISHDIEIFNLILLSYAIGFFLRVFTLSFNEFGTSTTYFVIMALPYISYQFLDHSQLKKYDKFIINSLAILFICLKPYYAIVAIVFSLRKGRFLAAIFYLFLLFVIAADPVIDEQKIYWMTIILRQDFFPLLAVVILGYSLIKKSQPLTIFVLATAAIGVIIVTEMLMGYDQRFIFYVTFLSFLFVFIVEIMRQNYVNWKRDGVILFFMAVILQFSHDMFIDLIFNLSSFWWLFSLFLALSWKRALSQIGSSITISELNLAEKFLLQRDIISHLLLLLALFLTFYLAIDRSPLESVMSIAVFLLLLHSNQKLSEKLTGIKEFSRLSACVVLIVISYVISLHRVAIFVDHDTTSPNHVSDRMMNEIQVNLAKGEEFLVLSDQVFDAYPVINYADNYVGIASFNHSFEAILAQLKKLHNTMIFVRVDGEDDPYSCSVGFLENYMRHADFKEYFLKNYQFFNRIISTETVRKKVKFEKTFENEKEHFKTIENIEMIDRDIEIYMRRQR